MDVSREFVHIYTCFTGVFREYPAEREEFERLAKGT